MMEIIPKYHELKLLQIFQIVVRKKKKRKKEKSERWRK
jgi:hypothetical protein